MKVKIDGEIIYIYIFDISPSLAHLITTIYFVSPTDVLYIHNFYRFIIKGSVCIIQNAVNRFNEAFKSESSA